MEKRTKILIGMAAVLLVIAAGFWGYRIFFKKKPPPPKTVLGGPPVVAKADTASAGPGKPVSKPSAPTPATVKPTAAATASPTPATTAPVGAPAAVGKTADGKPLPAGKTADGKPLDGKAALDAKLTTPKADSGIKPPENMKIQFEPAQINEEVPETPKKYLITIKHGGTILTGNYDIDKTKIRVALPEGDIYLDKGTVESVLEISGVEGEITREIFRGTDKASKDENSTSGGNISNPARQLKPRLDKKSEPVKK